MRFIDKLFLTHFITIVHLIGDYILYKVYYAINPDGDLSIIASIEYNGTDHIFYIEIIGSK